LYIKGWRALWGKAALRTGSAVHEGIDIMAKGGTLEDAINGIQLMYDEAMTACEIPDKEQYDDTIKAMWYESVTAICLVTGYYHAWKNSEMKIIQSEKSFDLPIVNPLTKHDLKIARQAGVRDRVVSLPDGRNALMETKTVGEDCGPDSNYRHVLGINQQVSMYLNAAIAEDMDIHTTIYDCVRKPKIKPSAVACTEENGDIIVLDEAGERVLKKNGDPRKTGDTAKGYVIQKREMTSNEWFEKLMNYISADPVSYYQRFEVASTSDELLEFSFELYDVTKDIRACELDNRWYMNTSACRKWNSLCEYYPLCSKQQSSEECPQGFEEVQNVHQEIKEFESCPD